MPETEYRRLSTVVLLMVLAAMSGILAPARVAYAASITVTTTADELSSNSACSLREAIRAANLNVNVDTCPAGSVSRTDTITLPAGTYILIRTGADEEAALTGDLDVVGALTITGAGADTTIIDGNASDRILNIKHGGTLKLNRVTLTNGQVGDNQTTSVNGGAVYNSGTFTVNGVTISGNTAESNGGGIYNNGALALASTIVDDNDAEGAGGGIYNAASRVARITRSTISNNRAMALAGGVQNNGTMDIAFSTLSSNWSQHGGGGLAVIDGGATQITSSTISDNYAGESGGGVAAFRDGSVTLTNSTVSGNRGGGDDPEDKSWGGGIDNTGGSIALFSSTITSNVGGTGGLVGPATLANTILAGNTHYFTAEPSDCFGSVISQGYNLIEATTECDISGDTQGNLLDVSPRLGPLRRNGGATLTHALWPGSPAIDAGNPNDPGTSATACAAKDQRGVLRPLDGDGDTSAHCDIGAVERRSVSRP